MMVVERGGAYSTSMYPLHTNTSLKPIPALRCATNKRYQRDWLKEE
jgi:hypothetical protein